MNASMGDHIGVVNALILAGAVVDIQDEDDDTVLKLASMRGHTGVKNALRAAGATQ